MTASANPQVAGAGLVGTSSSGLSAVAYDGSNRVTSYTFSGVSYTVTGWGTSTITVTGNDGSVTTITLDGSGRIQAVV